jgi:hypothetical protein
MEASNLSLEELEEAKRIEDVVMAKVRLETHEMVMLMVSKPNGEFFGETEFRLRDASHRMAAYVLDAALEERKKRGIKGRASRVNNAVNPRNS